MKGRRALHVRGLAALLLGVVVAGGLVLGCASREERAAKHLAKAEQFEKEGQDRAALLELRSALKVAPQSAEVNYRIAQLLQRDGQLRDAVFYYKETLRLDPKRSDAALAEAFFLMQSDPKASEKLVKGVLVREPGNALAHVRLSQLALINKDTSKALQEALTATQLDPSNGAAQLQVGKVQQARIRQLDLAGKKPDAALYQAALDAFGAVAGAKNASASDKVQAAIERARVYASWPDHQKEVGPAFQQAYETAQKLGTPGTAVIESALEYGRVHRDQDVMIWALKRKVEIAPEDMTAWVELAQAEDPLSTPSSRVLTKLIQDRPDDARAQSTYAQDLANRGHIDDAIAHLEKVEDQVKSKDVLLSGLVNLQVQKKDLAAARQTLAKLAVEAPNTPQLYYAQARVAQAEGRLDDAVDAMHKVIGLNDTGGAERTLAELELSRGNTAGAAAALNRAMQLTPRGSGHFIFLVRLRARIEAARGEYHAVIRTYRALRRRMGSLSLADLPVLARAFYETGQADLARKTLAAALEQPEPPVEAVLLYARHEARRDPDGVRAALDKSLKQHPDDVGLVVQRAALDLEGNDPKAAEQRLRAAIAAQPQAARPRVMLVRLLETTGRREDALAEAQAFQKAAPSDPQASWLLARALIESGKVEAARQELEESEKKGQLAAGSKVLLARLDMATGHEDEAIQLLESALGQNENLPGAKNDLAFLLAKHGKDLDRALELAQDARKALPQASAPADTLGYVYLKRGLPEASISQFESAADLANPGSVDWATAQFHLGLAYQAMNKPAEARAAFNKALAQDFPGAAEARAALAALPPSKG